MNLLPQHKLAKTYNLMHSLIEYFILAQYQKDDQGHINMVRVAVGCVVQSLQNRNHLETSCSENAARHTQKCTYQLLDIRSGYYEAAHVFIAVNQQIQQQSGLVGSWGIAKCLVHPRKVDCERIIGNTHRTARV
jgi:hypothetical protein